MKYLFTIYILLTFISKKGNSCFTENDKNVILSLTKPLGISFCVLVKETCNNHNQLSNLLKEFSKENLFFSYLDFSDFLIHFLNQSISNSKTMIIVKSDNEIDTKIIVNDIKEKISFRRDFSTFTWMMFLPRNAEKLSQFNFQVPYDCQFIVAQKLNGKYDINEIYQVKKNSIMVYTHIGVWDRNFQSITIDKYFYMRRKNMNGDVLYVETTTEKPCRTGMECTQHEIWLDLAQTLNFTTKYIYRNSLDRRNIQPDASTQTTPYHIYNPNFYFMIAPTLLVKSHVYIRFETEDEQGWGLYLQPIHPGLKRALYYWAFTSAIAIAIIAKMAQKHLSLDGFTIYDQALTPISALCFQNCIHKPHIISSRMARLSTFLASTVLVPAYSAALISCLTVLRPKIPFTDLETFAQDGTFKMGAIYHPFIASYFTYDPNPAVRKIYNEQLMPMKDFPRKHLEAYEILCNKQRHAIIAFNYRILQDKTPCPIIKVTESILNTYTGIALRPGSSYRGVFNKILITIRASGVLYKLQRIIFGREVDKAHKDFQAINLRMTTSLHMLLAVSMTFSLMLLMIEITWQQITLRLKFGRKSNTNMPDSKNENLKKEMLRFSRMCYWENKKNSRV